MTENAVSVFSKKLQNIKSGQPEKPIINELKSLVMNSDKQVLTDIVQNCELNPVFDCLNSADEEQIELSCIILYNLLKYMKPNECLSQYNKLLQRALSHPSPVVKSTLVKLMNDMVNNETAKSLADKYPTLLVQATECIGNSERSVAEGAITLFINIGSCTDGLNVLYSRMVLDKFREMLGNEIARFRVFEIASAISHKSPEGLKASQNSGILNLLLSEVKSEDPLLQLNALEILSSFGSTHHGYVFLQECGIIEFLYEKILKLEDEPLSLVLLPGLIEFFGNICKEDPEEFIKNHTDIINLLFKSLETSDEVLIGVIYSTIGKIGSSYSGKLALHNRLDQMRSCLKRASELLNRRNDTTVSVLHSMTMLFSVKEEDGKLSDLLRIWYEFLGSDFLETLMGLTKLPFIELRLSALSLVNAIARLPWGTEKLCHYPGMIEYLTDRSTEFHKDCKKTKYDIVCSLSESTVIAEVLPNETLEKLREFVREGPYFVRALSPEMMTEGAS